MILTVLPPVVSAQHRMFPPSVKPFNSRRRHNRILQLRRTPLWDHILPVAMAQVIPQSQLIRIIPRIMRLRAARRFRLLRRLVQV
jgi:hypothetical protein